MPKETQMTGDELTQVRVAENQTRFRESNEKIEEAAERAGFAADVPFLCECADERCMEILRLTLDEYEEVRGHPRRFFNAPGHEALSVESGAAVVVASNDRYVLVDKINRAGEIAEQRYELTGRSRDE